VTGDAAELPRKRKALGLFERHTVSYETSHESGAMPSYQALKLPRHGNAGPSNRETVGNHAECVQLSFPEPF
jgi:hypothetical protein